MSKQLYKILGENGNCHNGGIGEWHLPKNGKPGKWMPRLEGELIPCQHGYHLCREQDLIHWLGPIIWLAEYKGKRIDDNDKVVVRQSRLLSQVENWNERTARLFACDCAEKALELVEAEKRDSRSIEAIRVARLYAIGKASKKELDAARAAAWDVAWAAARAAARAAAWDVAWDAARAAARAAARDVAREWQTERLMMYLNGELT